MNRLKKQFIPAVLALQTLLLLCSYTVIAVWENVDYNIVSKELIDINARMLKSKVYSFNVRYKTFKGHFAEIAYQQHEGKVWREGINYRSEIMGKLIVQNKSLRVTVDSAAKLIKVSNPFEGAEPGLDPESYIKVMKTCKKVQRKQEKGTTGFRFEMNAKQGIVAQEIFFGSDFIDHLVYYYANVHSIRENDKIKEEIVYPKVTIDFSDFKKPGKISPEVFDTDAIVHLQKGKLTAAEKYRHYKLTDGRLKK